MATIEQLKKGKGEKVVITYGIGSRPNEPGHYTPVYLHPVIDFDRFRSQRLHTNDIQYDAELGIIDGPGNIGDKWTSVRRWDTTVSGDDIGGEHDIFNGSEIILDPSDKFTRNRLGSRGIRLIRARTPTGLRLETFPLPGMKDYFAGAEVLRRPIPETRPWDISHWIVDELPYALELARTGHPGFKKRLEEEAERQISTINEEVVTSLLSDPFAIDIACLDLCFLRAGLGHSQIKPSKKLEDLIELISAKAGFPPTLTPEMLVTINPLDSDPRLFTTGEVASSELAFLWGIRDSEQYWGFAHEDLRLARTGLYTGYPDKPDEYETGIAISRIDRAAAAIHRSAAIMQEYGGPNGLNPEHFAKFRVYEGEIPPEFQGERKYKGPSGLYAGFAGPNIQSGGEYFSQYYPGYYAIIGERLDMYPRHMTDILREAAVTNGMITPPSVVYRARELHNPGLLASSEQLEASVRGFRTHHMAAASEKANVKEIIDQNGTQDPLAGANSLRMVDRPDRT